jgi:hypothetical protein
LLEAVWSKGTRGDIGELKMDTQQKTARIAGLLYFLVTVTGLFSLMYVPGQLFVHGNPIATIHSIFNHQSLYETYIVVGLMSEFLFITVVLLLYRLLKDVNSVHAALMVILVLLAAPFAFIGESYHVAILTVARGVSALAATDKSQADVFTASLLRLDDAGTTIAEIFWGLWLLPLGSLVFRSGFLPKFLGVWLGINGIGYVILSATSLLLPEFQKAVFIYVQPALFGEMALMLWLLIFGAKKRLSEHGS